jgi:hypothetical protein
MDWSTLPWDKIFVIVTVLVAGPGIIAGIAVPAIGQAIVAYSGLKGNQPSARSW